MNILWTGDRGFIAGYAIQELLNNGHTVIGVDNNWKYGPVEKTYDSNPNYVHYDYDCKDKTCLCDLVTFYNIDTLVLGAAIIGGISLFHTLAYDLLAENERLTATGFDMAINMHKKGKLNRLLAISSSMIFESTEIFPSKEGDQYKSLPPLSTYGFQKLAVEYFAKGLKEQYNVPTTIVRPFNCVGIGENRAKIDKEVMSGNIKLAMSHVVPDLVQKIYKGQYPLRIFGKGNQKRHYTYAGDLAKGIYLALTKSEAEGEDFNMSTSSGHTVLELARVIWNKMIPNKEFSYVSDEPFKYDVQNRVPSVEKAKVILGYEALTTLETALDEIIPWVCKAVDLGLM